VIPSSSAYRARSDRITAMLRLPPIAPFNIDVFSVLREAHSILAYL
jgi:hypothetical protein